MGGLIVLFVYLNENDCTSADDVHAHIARELNFPSYYGNNLDALNDCLSDISESCLIRVERTPVGEDDMAAREFASWFDRLCLALMRAARSNPALTLDIVCRGSSL